MRRTFKLSLLIEIAALSVGGMLLGAYLASQLHFAHSRDEALQAFSAARQNAQSQRDRAYDSMATPAGAALPGRSDITLTVAAPDMSSWSAERIAAYQESPDSATPAAVLRIPSIRLEVPVYAGVSELNLNRGAAWIEGTAPLGSPGNAGIASHRDGYFRALRDIEVGDRIELRTLTRTQSYVVDALSIVPPQAIEVLGPADDARLTLVTCYPFYVVGPAPKRFVVQAHAAR